MVNTRLRSFRASLVAQRVKHLPAMQETWVWSLGGEDPLEKEMATHSSTLAWKIPWMEKPGRLQSMGSQRFGHDWATSFGMPQTGPDNPLLCHYFCYYMKWVSDNDMFTIRNTLTCSYGGLKKWKFSYTVVSDPLWPHGLKPTRLLFPCNFPSKSTGVGCHFLLQRIFTTQESSMDIPHCRQML